MPDLDGQKIVSEFLHLHTWSVSRLRDGSHAGGLRRGLLEVPALPEGGSCLPRARLVFPVENSIFSARRLSSSAQRELLQRVVGASRYELGSGAPAPVVVFDLDGTLLDNRPRVVSIFQELAAHWEKDFPDASRKLSIVGNDDIVYGVDENLQRAGIAEADLRTFGQQFWKERFFIDGYMRFDTPTKGAVDFVRACYANGASIVYLTGRDLPNMAVGTFASLRDAGFPIGVVGTTLVTKPAFEIPDAAFKNEVAPGLARHGRVVAAFDNEPANNNLFAEHHAAAHSIFLDTHHAPNPPALDERVIVIENFVA